jgi:hypothetical protein
MQASIIDIDKKHKSYYKIVDIMKEFIKISKKLYKSKPKRTRVDKLNILIRELVNNIYINDKFQDNYANPNIDGDDFIIKIEISTNVNVKINIKNYSNYFIMKTMDIHYDDLIFSMNVTYDIAGNVEYHKTNYHYHDNIIGATIIYDETNEKELYWYSQSALNFE